MASCCPAGNLGPGLTVALDHDVTHPRFQDPDLDVSPLDVHIRYSHHDVAVPVVALLNAVEVVAEEDAVKDRPHLGEDLLHQDLARVDGVTREGNRLDHRVLPDGVNRCAP